MGLLRKKKDILPVPEGCENLNIEVDKSICTGEMTIGFREPGSGKLLYAELVRNETEVEAFKQKYGWM